ncbi:hypothetical protein EDC45_0068 [Mesocricetibacter intestinalis]|uniref:Der GTPase-activating protein YihI n=1 Tax=Mesocricetibacter intestinalis TaxID=1521930 RepID=A0A4R6VF95_9PAST|nr:Der GTPase-activating protein YihI [Mesocricetibacter intestinalis]TDQ59421.1 hypothetical protein EDC45_0068 [Mesocricetibacter intestinalis]
MSRQKKTRRITDIMPARKSDKKSEGTSRGSGRRPTRYELDAKAREEKRKKKHKGLAAGSRHSSADNQAGGQPTETKDPRIGSRKKVPLIVEFVNKPPREAKVAQKVLKDVLSPEQELERLENNECLNQLLDALDAGKTLSADEHKFVEDCLERIAQLMEQLGIEDEDEDEEDLYRSFENIDINRFK